MRTMLFWFLLFLAVFSYCLISEFRSQDCTTSCENLVPLPEGTDTKEEINQKIASGTRILYQSVDWRKAMMVAIASVIFIVFVSLYYKNTRWAFTKTKFPRGIDLAIPLLTVFIAVYFGFMYLQDSFWKPIAIKIREAAEDI